MGSCNRQMNLREQIAAIMDVRADARALRTEDSAPHAGRATSRMTLRQSVAYGSMMMLAFNPAQVGAMGLGDMRVKSRLGQPLEASVPLTLGAGESLPKNCLQPTFANNTLRSPQDLRVQAPAMSGPGRVEVRITTANPLREPMYELSLMVKCTGVSLLVRQYVLMLDLPGMPQATTTQYPTTATTVATESAPRQSDGGPTTTVAEQRTQVDPARALPPRTDGIPAGSMYRVSSGDTLSTIARRVNGRLADTTWQVADRIYADNPAAFIRNDPNLIKLGSLIRVPASGDLAAMIPGAGRSATLAAGGGPVVTAASATAIETQRGRMPETTARTESLTTRRPVETVDTPVSQSLPLPAPAATADVQTPVAEVAPTERSESFYPFADDPFADETPDVEAADVPADVTPAPTPVVKTTADETADGPSNSLLSILIGLLLGALLSLALLRGRLLGALGLRRHTGMASAVKVTPKPSPKQGSFDESLAAAAFDGTSSGIGDDGPGFPISGPVEDTYIVEASEAEPTIQDEAEGYQPDPAEAATVAAEVADRLEDSDNSAELAKLFDDGDENEQTAVDPTAEMPRPGASSLEPTAEMPGPQDSAYGDYGPTAEMPKPGDDGIFDPTANVQAVDDGVFDPTAELPPGALEDVFDPTGGIDNPPSGEIDPALMDAFDERLDEIDPEEMFATLNQPVGDIHGRRATDPLEVTINDPLEGTLMDDATVASELSDLPSDDEDGNLSETLHEALALLERDFEEEFTASQVLERSALEESLKEDLERQDSEATEDDVKKRKIS
ncbi:MAG: type IV pilus assembly protein FimV [Gammaproteobacteria bacterium]